MLLAPQFVPALTVMELFQGGSSILPPHSRPPFLSGPLSFLQVASGPPGFFLTLALEWGSFAWRMVLKTKVWVLGVLVVTRLCQVVIASRLPVEIHVYISVFMYLYLYVCVHVYIYINLSLKIIMEISLNTLKYTKAQVLRVCPIAYTVIN